MKLCTKHALAKRIIKCFAHVGRSGHHVSFNQLQFVQSISINSTFRTYTQVGYTKFIVLRIDFRVNETYTDLQLRVRCPIYFKNHGLTEKKLTLRLSVTIKLNYQNKNQKVQVKFFFTSYVKLAKDLRVHVVFVDVIIQMHLMI